MCTMCKDSILKAHNMSNRKVTCITLHTYDVCEGGIKRRVGKTNGSRWEYNIKMDHKEIGRE